MNEAPPAALEEAWGALSRADWPAARDLFQTAADENPSGEALDGLGQANWWLGDEEEGIELRTKAFNAYKAEGANEAAANVAVYLAAEYRIAGNSSLSNGWLGRATRLLEGCDDCVASGWLEIEHAKRGATPKEKESHGMAAVGIARRIGDSALESAALSHAGLGRLAQGDPQGGLSLLDEAMAIAMGESEGDPLAIGDACCTTLMACEELGDPQRARDWGRSISEFIRRRNYVPLVSWCRAVYAGFLLQTGKWAEAEAELKSTLDEADRQAPGSAGTALAYLAELRVRQGRFEKARQLLSGIEDRPAALAAIVELHIAGDELDLAAERVERRLEAVAGKDPVVARTLGLQSSVALAKGDAGAARQAAEQMAEAGERAGRDDLVALAQLHLCRAALATGNEAPAADLEQAIDTFAELEMPLEEGEARLELARALASTHPGLAVEQGRAALAIFERLGAARHADTAAGALRELGDTGRPAPRSGETLTKRERQVLGLLGEGLSNPEIAERLVISPKTAEHHVSSILMKLGLRNRAEAAAFAVREGGGSDS